MEATIMDLGLAGRRVVVTGAGGGIGLAVTRGFVEEGARVVAGSRRITPALRELADEGEVLPVEVDLAEPDGPARLVAAAEEPVDVLVNNVGIAPPRVEGFLAVTDAMWHETWNLDVMAAVRATRAALPGMLAAGHGVIVNVGSVNARLADPLVVDYSGAKAALTNVAKSLSKEFGPRGIRVNTIAPGPVATDLWLGPQGVAAQVGASGGQSPEAIAAGAAGQMVTGRFSRPSEVADLVLVLASERFANVTGAEFTIDGGMVTTL
jgi:NAD(P)-dependent dehydrogenase (short-subunit alcohol dehydrogenase family)